MKASKAQIKAIKTASAHKALKVIGADPRVIASLVASGFVSWEWQTNVINGNTHSHIVYTLTEKAKEIAL